MVWKDYLDNHGFVILTNVLDKDVAAEYKKEFEKWQATIPHHNSVQQHLNKYGTYRYHHAGHARHAWMIRCNPHIQKVFQLIHNTSNLITSLEGGCYVGGVGPQANQAINAQYSASVQKSINSTIECIQGMASLTANSKNTMVMYAKSHKSFHQHFERKQQERINQNLDVKKWKAQHHHTIDEVDTAGFIRVALDIPIGSLVLWNSRTFHSIHMDIVINTSHINVRIGQPVCFLPQQHKKNSEAMKKKRLNYLETLRTTTHSPYPIHVHPLQPNLKLYPRLEINYDRLQKPVLDDLMADILKIV